MWPLAAASCALTTDSGLRVVEFTVWALRL